MYQLKNNSANILIVEDNAFDMLVLNTLLKNHFNISLATNGNDALLILKENVFDIILMDINLGDNDLDGFKLIEILKDNQKHQATKIIAVTAFSKGTEFYLDKGFDGVFEKPVIKEDLFDFIKKEVNANFLND